MLPQPSVSVCIPVYNGERFLAETIRSVLDQTYRDFEIVLLENASTDASLEIIHSFADPRIRVERNATLLSQPDNWNRVIQLCRAPLIKLVCADDLLHPRCLEFQVGPMEADPGLAVVAARRHMVDEQSRVIVPRRGLGGLLGVRTSVEVARKVVRNGANPIGEPGGVLFRRDHFFAAGGWRADRRFVMDLDLWLRLLQYGEFLGLPETLAAFRIGRGSVSAENEQAIYEDQRLLIEELGESPYYQVRGIDLALGRVLAPAGRARRQTLFAISRFNARKEEKGLAAESPD
ncbi:glycosyltransferase [Pseudonocardia asaccharolytica]|uniref:Glycosyl hydrolase n=1 Tax=Pseudonocardia asaccharolytica DSM 44247 = NBRC 16224 TaxID=1123024 RepID=A0A511CVW6_9PSEU|nr:glycosyltransferase [Pseudonocardia asaccharolytica]GEL16719.1 glycosyl hydrolase [Pseudonocardia asaccharolytica DSM 44247 = NBRC 16224]